MIRTDSLVTLNFRVMHPNGRMTYLSTFESTPTTVQMGAGELAPGVEARLLGLPPGTRTAFDMAAGEAFGDYDPRLVERVDRRAIPPELKLEADMVFSFPAPDGSAYPGLVREITATEAVIDFNHPLAGKAVKVEVEIIGVI